MALDCSFMPRALSLHRNTVNEHETDVVACILVFTSRVAKADEEEGGFRGHGKGFRLKA